MQTITPENIIVRVSGTRPWVLLFAILGFLSAAGIALTTAAVLYVDSSDQVMIVAMISILLLLFYLVPSVHLYHYSCSVKKLKVSKEIADLEKALNHQRLFWKSCGIMIVIGMPLVILASL